MSFVSFAIDITPAGTVDVIVVDTDLHLYPRHREYNGVQRLLTAAQEYLAANADRVTHIRLVSNRSGEI
ncbi:hypothetical protein [Bradyrhizobium sp. LB11.1]|uniref:hypothetical protein n=1 Tax=Bradyrhizobium sp. LB11.1 TaxID=3156326 RepID=UPI0033927A9C